jgi:phospholipid/cholesterol/gamma-HCH transport system substrate-binding protein
MDDRAATSRVGAVVMLALVLLIGSIIVIGQQSRLFSPKNEYTIEFVTVGGLKSGSPVELNGVEVGQVVRVELPRSIDRKAIIVRVSIDRVYADRVRGDSLARIRSLGLIGDKYVEIRGGSGDSQPIDPGGRINTAPATDVDKLISSGEDLVDRVQSIAAKLDSILERVDRGEGLIGELTSDQEAGQKVTTSLVATMETIQRVAAKAETGDGLLGALVSDPSLATRFVSAVENLDATLSAVRNGPGLAPRLLNDAGLADRFDATLASIEASATTLARTVEGLETSDALVPKLLTDEEYGAKVSAELEQLIAGLNAVAAKLADGDGTAARLIDDPSVYQALEDVVIGVEESAMLRWLVRNRQKAGIRKRYEDAQTAAPAPPVEEPSALQPPGGAP